MKLSLCPRSSFPAPIAAEPVAPSAPSDDAVDPTSLLRVDPLPPRKDARGKGWLYHRVRRDTDSDN